MNRRNFLIMAFGAVLAVPSIGETAKLEKLKTDVCANLNKIALLYVNASTEDREYVISGLNEYIAKMRRPKAIKSLSDYRDFLLSLNVIPASEVEDAEEK